MSKGDTERQHQIKSQLLKIARERKVQLEQILGHYAIERLLYRLSISKHKERFLLKGAMLFTAWELSEFRTTRDLDLLGFGDSTPQSMQETFKELFSLEYSEDGILFLADSLQMEEIRKEEDYTGVRIKCFAKLHTAKIPVQIDIGIGDAVYPAPTLIDFPTLLEMPSPRLKAYKTETVVAEKLETIVRRGMNNTRLKDYFDLLYLSRHFEFNGSSLVTAIRKTFERRETEMESDPPVGLTSQFYESPTRIALWNPFARKLGELTEGLSLESLVEEVARFVLLPLNAAQLGEEFNQKWKPGGPWGKE